MSDDDPWRAENPTSARLDDGRIDRLIGECEGWSGWHCSTCGTVSNEMRSALVELKERRTEKEARPEELIRENERLRAENEELRAKHGE